MSQTLTPSREKSPIRKIWSSCPLARQTHICCVCGHPIAIGSRYERHVIVDLESTDRARTVFKFHRGLCPREVLDVR